MCLPPRVRAEFDPVAEGLDHAREAGVPLSRAAAPDF